MTGQHGALCNRPSHQLQQWVCYEYHYSANTYHNYTDTHLNTHEPLLQLLYALLTISEPEQGQVHGTLGVETLVSGVVDFLQDRTTGHAL